MPTYGTKEETWDKVNHMFFSQPENQAHKDCYQPGSSRKLCDQFKALKKSIAGHPGWPSFKTRNLSGITEDEPNKTFKLLRRIEMDLEDRGASTKTKEEEKRHMEAIEKAITKDPLESQSKKRVKRIDGNVTGNKSL